MKAVRHFGIVVSDMERSLCFYRDLLGLRVIREMDESGDYLDNMLAIEDVHVRTAKLSADGGSALIELLEFKSHRGDKPIGREIYSVGPSHVAFTVKDLDALYNQLSQAGIRFNAPPQLSPDAYAKVTFCKDPDGTFIEIVEVLRGEN